MKFFMENNLELELERIRLTNYILQKENELLLGTINNIANEKRELLEKIEESKKNSECGVKAKLKNKIKRIIRRR